ncbi:RES family NAD+ phosphorylase [Pseudomonas sp. RP23018S]|uniref:RES family NAD+ phosphorylase n=1 Tax=Pseudomonas sp. RP23018S TaxID=3096037 RepID=UPI002ACA6B3F|nr:RES family NAD+ phosphorylase [Pseudomonas sp. RP23018S]MDZ5604315.1 RES family NAD+ phosphorylase [Pseudomonas sp. RP23018S]
MLENLAKYKNLIRIVPNATYFYRTQPSKYDAHPINYKTDSYTRYADPEQKIGVFYLGFSEEVAIAESFQSGQGVDTQAVPEVRLMASSLYRYETLRPLRAVDIGVLANRVTHHKLRDLVQAKGQGARGYQLTRALSYLCMHRLNNIDGLLYPSAVYSVSGSMLACNLMLFGHRAVQVKALDYRPVAGAVLSQGETTEELLESLGVILV